ncbi:hypothetical protein BABINDRAFT_161712 [Babjeviella inositovora NRRL Y-12698]|uniref:Transcription factor IIIA n=1 Tax=Babjeviella inositovora NRRL Y-12698 TaxID=984486 RepID=A0A1E3QT31_9ASCO|nr:uncharacterized protein BABINDRAFT_161712 [Babjeviella inositovora NRRL Y-12698]ODQ80077.1 hypothetical protein BABINDRAFT_161712 [Babjeviella inositovora NRRL Y-12698]
METSASVEIPTVTISSMEIPVSSIPTKRARSRSNSVSSVTSTASNRTLNSTTTTGSSRPKNLYCDFPDCNKAYSRPSLLTQHQRSHSGDRPFQCTHCDKSFLRNSHLQAHLVSHSQDKPFHCSLCGKGVNSRQHLKRHEITHTKTFECTYDTCKEVFYKQQTLRHHINTVHEPDRLTCDACGKVFNRPYRLATHKQTKHGASPAYQCTQPGCFQSFKTWSAVNFHVRTAHPKLTCSKCGKKCIGIQGLQMHMMVHDEEKVIKLWKCEYCVESFLNKKLLFSHYDEVHDGNVPAELLSKKGDSDDETPALSHALLQEAGKATQPLAEALESVNPLLESPEPPRKQTARSSSPLSTSSVTSVMDLIAGNVALGSQTGIITCPKQSCDRLFRREYDLKRHLKWHDEQLVKVERYLSGLPVSSRVEEQSTEHDLSMIIGEDQISTPGFVQASEMAVEEVSQGGESPDDFDDASFNDILAEELARTP